MMDDDLEVEALLRSDNEEDIEIKQVSLKCKADNDNFHFFPNGITIFFGMVTSIYHILN